MLIRNNFDGGTNGTGMTTGNTGGSSGDAFSAVEAAAIFSNEQKKSGTLSMKPSSAAVSSYGRWAVGEKNIAVRMYVYMTAAHSADYNLLQFRSDTTTNIASVRMTGASNLRLYLHGSSSNAWTSTATFPLNQWVRVEVYIKMGTTTSNGEARIAYYLGDSTTAVQDSGALTGLNVRGDLTNTGHVFIGKTGSGAYGGNFYLDSVALNAGTDFPSGSGLIGPDLAPLATPIVTPTYVSPSSTSATDGSITITWSAVTDADHYEVSIEDGTITSGFIATDTTSSTTYTFTGLDAGTYTWAVRAMAS